MPRLKNPLSVPKNQQDTYDNLVALTDDFCKSHLDEDYAALARKAIAALCRKRPSPLGTGKAESWACAVLYALGQINFLSDKASQPFMSMADLTKHFGIAISTANNKAKRVRKAIDMDQFNFEWTLPALMDNNAIFWSIMMDGYMLDARKLPRALQKQAFEAGIIPYIHADRSKSKDQIAKYEEIHHRYDIYRKYNADLQSDLLENIWENGAKDIALRTGILTNAEELEEMEESDIVLTLDLALYQHDKKGQTVISREVESLTTILDKEERLVYTAMCNPHYSIFEVIEKHKVTGTVLRDIFTDETYWIVDNGLESGAKIGTHLALRLIRPRDFWIGTGISPVILPKQLKTIQQQLPVKKGEQPNPDALAECIYTVLYKAE